MAASDQNCPVVLLTTTHSLSGQLDVGEQRLSDFLNIDQGSTILLRDATIAELYHPGKPIARTEVAVVRRSGIALVFEMSARAVSPTKRFYSYKTKQEHAVLLALDGMEIRGKVHTAGSLDLRSLFPSSGDRFLPLTSARVTLFGSDRYVIEQDAIIVNTQHVKFACEMPEQPSEKPKSV